MLIMEKNRINEWLGELAKKKYVIAPIRRDDPEESVFEKFESCKKIDFDYLPTVRSIKEFFLPAKENVFVFNKSRGKIGVPKKTSGIVLFGLNSRDLEALKQLDEIMSKPNNDYFYFEKRNAAVIIGLINEPMSIEHQTSSSGDLILLKINSDQYQAIPLTPKGKELTKNKLFKKEAGLISAAFSQSGQNEAMPELRRLLLDPELLSDAVTWSWKHDLEVWDELANLCLGCGICTYVCPLCYCFFTEDEVSLDGKNCSRCRSWDACTLPRFAKISGGLPAQPGFNFHKTIRERYYNWFFHKFVRAYKEYGKSQCVACGRCQKYCPAKIDIEKYLIRIVENYKKAMMI